MEPWRRCLYIERRLPTKQELGELYQEELLSDSEIASRFSWSSSVISALRKKYGIPTLSKEDRTSKIRHRLLQYLRIMAQLYTLGYSLKEIALLYNARRNDLAALFREYHILLGHPGRRPLKPADNSAAFDRIGPPHCLRCTIRKPREKLAGVLCPACIAELISLVVCQIGRSLMSKEELAAYGRCFLSPPRAEIDTLLGIPPPTHIPDLSDHAIEGDVAGLLHLTLQSGED